MGCCTKCLCISFILTLIVIVAITILSLVLLYKTPDVPKYALDKNWGPKYDPAETAVRPFTIKFDVRRIEEIKRKLSENYSFQSQLEGSNYFEYGINATRMEIIVKYWRDDYMPRWREREAFFNSMPHYRTSIQGLKIHFIHLKPSDEDAKGKEVIPILLMHGWPGSVREFYEFIPELMKPIDGIDKIFEVVAPSLPGFGWSDATNKVNFNVVEVSIVLRNLMIRLGYKKFVIQGGDWGSVAGNVISTIFPENVHGYHSNLCQVQSPLAFIKLAIASVWPTKFIDEKYKHMTFPAIERATFILEQTGYFHLQATKPDTIGNALENSPIGQAAYILEKFLDSNITDEALIDNLMTYVATNRFTTSVRIYKETFGKSSDLMKLNRVPTNVPTGCARFEKDLPAALDWQLRDKFTNLIHSTYYLDAGHFASFEVPKVLYEDFKNFVVKVFKK